MQVCHCRKACSLCCRKSSFCCGVLWLNMVHSLVKAIVVWASILGVGPWPVYSLLVWTSRGFRVSTFLLLDRLLLPLLSALRSVSKMLRLGPVVFHCCVATSQYPVSGPSAIVHFRLRSISPLMVVVVLWAQEQHFHLLTDPCQSFSRHRIADPMPLVDRFLHSLSCTAP